MYVLRHGIVGQRNREEDLVKKAKRIYCIEGHWDYGNREVEPSVQPMLEQMRNMGLWDYARRDCATMEELKYFLRQEWHRCNYGSILYFATHGAPGEVWLSDDHVVALEQLGAELEGQCSDCLVHFGGCHVMAAGEAQLDAFMEKTGAMGVLGYKVEAGWTSALDGGGSRQPVPGAPALALELLFFSTIHTEGIQLTDGRQFRKLRKLAANLQSRFEDCEFDREVPRDVVGRRRVRLSDAGRAWGAAGLRDPEPTRHGRGGSHGGRPRGPR